MKKLFTLVALCGLAYFAWAQCTPDPSYVSQGVGVYPKPDSTCNGTACSTCTSSVLSTVVQGQAYSFTFTAVVPSTLALPGFPVAPPITSITITGVSGLPSGLTYQCDVAGCVIPGNSTHCVVITGTTNDPIGYYPFVVNVDVNIGLPTPIPYTFPDTSLAPGCYVIKIDTTNVGINEIQFSDDITAKPNPLSENTLLSFNATETSQGFLRVLDLQGKEVKNMPIQVVSGRNEILLDASDLSNGVYYYTLEAGNTIFRNRLMVSQY